MSKLSAHLVTWNGAKYIPYLFESLRVQIFRDWELLVIDNGSKDGTADLIEQELKNFPVFSRFIQNKENVGFARGHNQAVRMTGAHNTECFLTHNTECFHAQHSVLRAGHAQHSVLCAASEYAQLLNQDMYLAPDYFEKIVEVMDNNPEAGAGQGVLLRWNFPPPRGELRLLEAGLTGAIDTMGLKVLRNRRVVDLNTGCQMSNVKCQMSGAIEVFGVSGALPTYRRSAIEQVMYEDQALDEDFFMYKEDVDLAFRLRSAGWKAFIDTSAKAWHDRSAAGPRQMSDKAAVVNRKSRSAFINYHSYKNHLMVLIKNERCANLAKDWPWIFWYEFKKFAYLLLTDWKTLKGLSEVKRLWPRLMQKRKQVMNNYKIKPEEMRKWFIH